MTRKHEDRRLAPHGSWNSPISAALVAGRSIGLSMLRADGESLLWLESRPAEAGRTVLRRQQGDDPAQDATPAPFDVGSRVHEYGGGAYAAAAGHIGFSHRPDGSVWLIEPGHAPRPVSAVPGLRFADFCFTPDGRHLLAVREDARDGEEARAAIVALPLDGRDAACNAGEVLVSGADFLSSPRVSPDGATLAWIEWDHPAMPWDATRLHDGRLHDADGALPIRLASSRCLAGSGGEEALMQPCFAADGILHVCSDRSGWWNLYRLASDGSLDAVCPMQREIGLPPWVFGQRSYDFLPDGSLIAAAIEAAETRVWRLTGGKAEAMPIGAVAECPVLLAGAGIARLAWLSAAPDRPVAVTVQPSAAGAKPRILAAAHEWTPDAGEIARAEPIRFATPHGDAHAFFYPPADPRHAAPPGEKPPLVVMAHGGPTGMTTPALSLRVQWFTSRGIAVVDVNYGGSTGFGRAYRQRLDRAWGVVDVDDCIGACASLIEAGRVDPARIAIRGSSAGGFTVLAALTRSNLFSAACCLYGIGDLGLLARETHKFESRYLDRLIGRLPEDGAIYESRSPIRHLEALRCPVIFFHGLDDKVVPVEQTRTMADALRQRGVRAETHEFAGEAHGFRREQTIRAVLERELAFYGSVWGFTPSVSSTEAAG